MAKHASSYFRVPATCYSVCSTIIVEFWYFLLKVCLSPFSLFVKAVLPLLMIYHNLACLLVHLILFDIWATQHPRSHGHIHLRLIINRQPHIPPNIATRFIFVWPPQIQHTSLCSRNGYGNWIKAFNITWHFILRYPIIKSLLFRKKAKCTESLIFKGKDVGQTM